MHALVACRCLIITGIHIKGNSTLVLMHSGIVNGYQLLSDAHTTGTGWGTTALCLIYSLSSFSAFSFCVFVILTVLFLSWVPLYSIVCVNNLKENSRFSLVIPWPRPLTVHTLGTNSPYSVHGAIKPYYTTLSLGASMNFIYNLAKEAESNRTSV